MYSTPRPQVPNRRPSLSNRWRSLSTGPSRARGFGWLVVASALLLFGCDGSGGGTGGGGSPMEPGPAIVLVPDTADGPRVTLRAGPNSTDTRLSLEIVAEDVSDFAGGLFNFAFPTDLFAYRGSSNGAFLGLPVTVVGTSGNELFVSILSPVGVSADGSGVILRLEFDAVASGEGRFDFVSPEAFDSNQLELTDVRWFGADVIVDL